MTLWVRSSWILLVLLTSAMPLWAEPTVEEKAFGSAVQAFQDRSWKLAERSFGEYREKFPKAENLAHALKFQAEARIWLKNYSGAIELLTSGLPSAGQWRDEYLFWLAEAHFKSGLLEQSANQFAKFAVEFPGSPRALSGVLRQAEARARMDQWERVVNVLDRSEGLFRARAKAEPANAEVVRGWLLLADAFLKLGRTPESESSLAALANVSLEPVLLQQRELLMARIHFVGGHDELALGVLTNLPALATNQNQFTLAAEALELAGQIHSKLGHSDDAIQAWQQILGLPVAARRREAALVRTAELLLTLNRDAEAIQILENILADATNSPVSAVAWLTLGELRLRSFMAANVSGETNGTVATVTNLLPQALAAFDTVIGQFTNSAYGGKAQLGRGWCLWLGGNLPESRDAFQKAAASLTHSYEQAVARFKLGDVLVAQGESSAALACYKFVVAAAANSAEVRTNLAERALYQVVRMARVAGDVSSANAAMAELLQQFPHGFLAQKSLMSLGSGSGRDGDAAAARSMFAEFASATPDSPLVPEVQLAIVRTYEQERDWPKVELAYSQWLETYTNHPSRPRTEYFRALATARSGGESNALQLFTEFATRYPTNEFAPIAQRWIGDHFWRQDDFVSAEISYQQLADKYPASSLRYEALLKAGSAAVARDNPMAAISYFTNLTGDVNCPAKENAQALFATGDCYMSLKAEGTNQAWTNFNAAIKRFNLIIQKYPGTEISILAQGRMADCYWNLGQDADAAANYEAVLTNQLADAPMRFQAIFGQGLIDERKGQGMSGPKEAAYFLNRALEKYRSIIHQEHEPMDMFWIKKAGLQSLSVAETLKDWDEVSSLCTTLGRLLPTEQANLEKKKARAEQSQAQAQALEESKRQP